MRERAAEIGVSCVRRIEELDAHRQCIREESCLTDDVVTMVIREEIESMMMTD